MPQQRLFVSDSFAVLQDAFVAAVQALKGVDPLAPLTVLVPESFLALRLQRAVAWAGKGHLALHFLTLGDFAWEVAAHTLAQERRRPLSSLAASLIVKKLFDAVGPRTYFAPLADQPRAFQTLLRTIADLKQCDIGPQQIRTFLERAPQGKISRAKLDGLLALYQQYERFLAEYGLYDESDLFVQAAGLLEANSTTAPMLLYGFCDLTPLQRHFVAAALRRCDALVFFPWRGGNAYDYATATLTWFTSLGFHYSVLASARPPENKLTQLQSHLFEERSPESLTFTAKTDTSILFLSAPGEYREVRELGRIILELVRDHGLRFYEIGVLLRDPATYGQLAAETFTSMGIPCRLYGGVPLLSTQAGQSLLLLCQVLAENYTRSRVIEFIGVAEPPFPHLLGGLAESAAPARWEAFSLAAGIVRGAREWRDRLARLERDRCADPETDLTSLQSLRAFVLFMQSFLTASEKIAPVDSWQDWAEYTLSLCRSYVSPSEHTTQVEELLQRLAGLDWLGDPVPFAEWLKGVTAALSETTVRVGASETEGVFLGDVVAARGVQFRAVLIPGMLDGNFPRTPRQDPVLLDQERQYLAEFLGRDLRQRQSLHEAERLLFTLALQGATEKLVLSYPRSIQGGPVRVPSLYLLRALEALSGTSASFLDLEEWERRIPLSPFLPTPPEGAVDLLDFHLASAGQVFASREPTPFGYLLTLSPFFSSAWEAVCQRWDVPALTAFDGMLNAEVTKHVLRRYLSPAGFRLSASALELYARCPFRYFLTTLLGLSPLEDPEQVFSLHPRDRGGLLHDILYEFFSRLRQNHLFPLATQERRALTNMLMEIAEKHFQTFARTGTTGFALPWELERERMLECLTSLLSRECEADDGFVPTAFEVHFGGEEAQREGDTESGFFPSQAVQFVLADGEEIALRGRIDRIDLSADQQRARVIDYKTGKPVRGRFARGTALQLPLYLFAARALRPEHMWVSAEYAYVDRSGRSGRASFTEDTWADTLKTLRQIVTVLVGGIRSGYFFATPESCYPCPFPLICGSHAETCAARKQTDPRVELLCRIRVIE